LFQYSQLVSILIDDFQQRIEVLRISEKNADILKLLSDPFQVDPTGAAVKYQMELIDIQKHEESF